MAANIIWSEQALDDIDAIAEYINRDSPFTPNVSPKKFSNSPPRLRSSRRSVESFRN